MMQHIDRRSHRPQLVAVGVADLPRADEAIRRTIAALKVKQFQQEPLFDAAASFEWSLRGSAVKREGLVIEAAIKDAIEQTKHLRLLPGFRRLRRRPDLQFEVTETGWIVVLEIKRGSAHDSTKIRQFRSDVDDIPALIKSSLPLFPAENVRFHVVFVSGTPRLREGFTPDDLSRVYGLHIRSHILTARQRYSAMVNQVIMERRP